MEPPPAAPATSQATRFTPEMLQIRWRGFAPTVIGFSALLFAGLVLLGFYGGTAGVWTMLILGVTLGLTLTVAGMSWAGTIALADDPLRGLLFVLFPPYTFWRAIVRYDIFWQSMLVFFLGLIISFGCVLIATEALNSQFAQ
jgi:hypothetical protein